MNVYIFCATFIFLVHATVGDDLQVEVEQGSLRGEKLNLVTNDGTYFSFKGIPYAKPPVGSLRFKDPEPPLSWDGVRNATQHGSVCPQIDIFTNEYLPGSEDCLFLNVYTQNIKADPLQPVMFFIHGGGYSSSSGNVDEFGPDFLVNKGVVVVTINYRLGVLGFLSMETKDVPGNAGLKDQLAALKWVNKNIDKFGGDPQNVTIFGQSAGAACVGYHTISPLSKGYFKRAIVMSGSPLCDWSLNLKPAKRARMLGQVLSNNYITNDTELLDYLQSVPYENLVKARPTILASEEIIVNLIKVQFYTPVPEKDVGQEMFLPEKPEALLEAGNVNNVDLMFGYTNHEAILAIPAFEQIYLAQYNRYPELITPVKVLLTSNPTINLDVSDTIREYFFGNQNISTNTMKEMVNYVSNATFVYDVQRFFRHFPNPANNARYFYKFSCYSQRNAYGTAGAKYNLTGAAHKEDLLYVFDPKSLNLTLEKNTTEYTLINTVTTLFSNFAKYGNPTPDTSFDITWPQFDNETLQYVDIGTDLTVSYAADEEHMQFWKRVLALAGIEF